MDAVTTNSKKTPRELRLCPYASAQGPSGILTSERTTPGLAGVTLGESGSVPPSDPAEQNRRGLQINLSQLKCPDFPKSILPALIFRFGFTTLHCAFSPIQDVCVVEKGYFVSCWVRKFAVDHLSVPLSRIFFRCILSSNHFALQLEPYGVERVYQLLVCGIQHAVTRV
jgi:hypothetical protein